MFDDTYMTHIYCRLYGVQHRLKITGVDFSKTPTVYTVDASDLLCMIPRIMVGAAYDTYTPYKVLKAGRADFKIKLIERLGDNVWQYTFTDYAGRMFKVDLTRRTYEADWDNHRTVSKRQSTSIH